jgi:hypothetical protein
MIIQLTPNALRAANVLTGSGGRGCGLLCGSFMGHNLVVDELVPAPFTRRSLGRVLDAGGGAYGERLIGVWFSRCAPYPDDRFLGMAVLEIDDEGLAWLRCELDEESREARLVRLAEGGEP